MLKSVDELSYPDRYYAGTAGFIGSTLKQLHEDVAVIDLPTNVPNRVIEMYDAVRHAYIYSYYSYDLLRLAAIQSFACLELALRIGLGHSVEGESSASKRSPGLGKLLAEAVKRQRISNYPEHLSELRNMYAHGSETVLPPNLFLAQLKMIAQIIAELFQSPTQ